MSWRETTLGECFTIKHGFAFKSQYFGDIGTYIVLTPGNFNERGGFRARPGKDRFYMAEPPLEFILEGGDLIIAMTEQGEGLLGSSALVPRNGSYLHNQRIGLIENLREDKLDKGFLYHLFNSPLMRAKIRSSASGTKVRHTAPKRIYSMKVKTPTVIEQRKIAEILSAYADLIENNRRRIALLEEAARMVYREWFVRLRFPGHEHVKIVDGVPEGWERRSLGDLLTLKRGYDLPEARRVDGPVPVVSSSGITGYHNAKKVDGPGIVTGRYGTIGEVFMIVDDFWPLNTSLYVVNTKQNPMIYLLHLLRHLLTSIQSDKAAVPGLNRNMLHTLRVAAPPRRLRIHFEEMTSVSYEQLRVLRETNKKLARARDLLLPRLMSGEVAV